jgi:hypothetical protein
MKPYSNLAQKDAFLKTAEALDGGEMTMYNTQTIDS